MKCIVISLNFFSTSLFLTVSNLPRTHLILLKLNFLKFPVMQCGKNAKAFVVFQAMMFFNYHRANELASRHALCFYTNISSFWISVNVNYINEWPTSLQQINLDLDTTKEIGLKHFQHKFPISTWKCSNPVYQYRLTLTSIE